MTSTIEAYLKASTFRRKRCFLPDVNRLQSIITSQIQVYIVLRKANTMNSAKLVLFLSILQMLNSMYWRMVHVYLPAFAK